MAETRIPINLHLPSDDSMSRAYSSPVQGDIGELLENRPSDFSRRNFLKAAGFGLVAGLGGGCSAPPPVELIPFLDQPHGHLAGRPSYFASTCMACEARCGVLTKVRDGRPIKLEGNPAHPLSRGGLCAIGQASLLGLYDSHRYKVPQSGSKDSTWEEVDNAILAKLADLRAAGKPVRFLTSTLNSPTTQAILDRFISTFDDGTHVLYDPLSSSSILDAYGRTHGCRLLPRYAFSRAQVIVSFDADFLGTWISPVEYSVHYRQGRNLEEKNPSYSYHVQFESRMSLTGANADTRYRVAPHEQGVLLNALAHRVAAKAGQSFPSSVPEQIPIEKEALDDLSQKLWDARGKSLIVSGSQDVEVQILCNFINRLLENEGSTVEIAGASHQRAGNDRELARLIDEIRTGGIGALFLYGVNPCYDLPELAGLERLAEMVIDCSPRQTETSNRADFVCPDLHFLEVWTDFETTNGIVSIGQPVIPALVGARSLVESLSGWLGSPEPAYDSIRNHWKDRIYPRRLKEGESFDDFWGRTLQEGFSEVSRLPVETHPFDFASVAPVRPQSPPEEGALTLQCYAAVGMGDGRHAYNPWLQELPDPMTKVTWDNPASFSVSTARALSIEEGDIVRIEGEGRIVEVPAVIQPGQHESVVAIAIGYGQLSSARFKDIGPAWVESQPSTGNDGLVGKCVSTLLPKRMGEGQHERVSVTVTKTGDRVELARTQTQSTITVPENLAPEGGLRRSILHETSLDAFRRDPSSGKPHLEHASAELYPEDHEYKGRHWGMVIDPGACTGCSACVIACQVENNIPVVGKDEVRRRREMHWLRVDRYYSNEGDDIDVAFQPMMCQQCDQASCENVCPVLATVHTSEGLNAQVYNRCVGTRYCANNCPYKVRRFNWFDYPHEDPMENMVLNPDVTVRSRGVMEKCSFCVQRLEEAKIEAKRLGRPVTDESVQSACQQSCPSQAIVLGDMNDPNSKIATLLQSERYYRVLEELNTKPSVGYLTLVRNRPSEPETHSHDQVRSNDA